MKRTFIYLIISLLLVSCASKKYTKQGAKYEAAGMYEMAVSSYSTALIKKADNANARIGLMRSSTQFASNLQDRIESCYQASDDDGVVENYIKLESLANQMQTFRIGIEINARTTGQFNEAKNRFLVDKYTKGQEFLEKENFADAAECFKQVVNVDASYENAQELLNMSLCEPIYREAISNMENSKYRTAYSLFCQISKIDASYKDIMYQSNTAIANGMLTIYYMPITNGNKYSSESDAIMAQTKSYVAKNNDPFLKFVDKNASTQIIIKQKDNMLKDSESTTSIIPIRANLRSKIVVERSTSQLSNEKKKGFLRIKNNDDTHTDKPITYYERSQSRSITINYSFELISTITGEVLLTDNYSQSNTDRIHYIHYDGQNERKVYSSNGKAAGSSLKNLAKARKELLSYDDLEDRAIKKISQKFSKSLINYNPENQ